VIVFAKTGSIDVFVQREKELKAQLAGLATGFTE
jgi:hypothetical protein